MRLDVCSRLPDLAQHNILEYLDYKLRRGKYIKQLSKDLSIYKLLQYRPVVEEVYFDGNHECAVGHYIDDDNKTRYYDEDGYESYFTIPMITRELRRGHNCMEEILELSYSFGDRSKYLVEKISYKYDYYGTPHKERILVIR
jgi:hypothetical protein